MADFKQYLKLIQLNLNDGVEPSLLLLKKIVKAHLHTFPYQNTELFIQGRKPMQERIISPIHIDSIFEQMVIQRRSGYCFQNSELLAWALTNLGFTVTKHLAKIINCFSKNIREDLLAEEIFSHVLLQVAPPDYSGSWIVDTGFANNSLREPLAMRVGEQVISTERYRLSYLAQQALLRLEIKIHQEWFCLYDIDPNPQLQEQIDEANRQLFIHPKEPLIRTFLKLGQVTDEKRKSLALFAGGRVSFFKSLSSPQKHYDLVALTPETLFTRHTFAVWLNIEGGLNYSVLDPLCPKMEKSIITGIMSEADLPDEAAILFRNLRDGKLRSEEFLQVLQLFLPVLLGITSERGHTHRREQNTLSVVEFCTLAKEKFGIVLDDTVQDALSC